MASPVALELCSSVHTHGSVVEGKIDLESQTAREAFAVRLEVLCVSRRVLADGRSRQHEVIRSAQTIYEASSSNGSCPRSLDFDIVLPSAKTALPSSLRLRSRDGNGDVQATAIIEWSVVASIITASGRYRASSPFTFAPTSQPDDLPLLTLSPSRAGPPVLDARWRCESERVTLSRGLGSSSTAEFKIAVPACKSFASSTAIPFVIVLSARSAKQAASTAVSLPMPDLGANDVRVMLTQSHATHGQPTLSRDICNVLSVDDCHVLDTGDVHKARRFERQICIVGKFSYCGAASFHGPLDSISYSLRLECRLPGSSRPVLVDLPFALRSGLTAADLEVETGPATRSVFLGFELFRSASTRKAAAKGKGKEMPLSLTRSSSASSTVYSSSLSVDL